MLLLLPLLLPEDLLVCLVLKSFGVLLSCENAFLLLFKIGKVFVGLHQIFGFFDLGGPLALGERKDHYLSIVIYTGGQRAYTPYLFLALNRTKNLVVLKVVKG